MRTYAESCRSARVQSRRAATVSSPHAVDAIRRRSAWSKAIARRRIPYLRRVGGFFVRVDVPIIDKLFLSLLVALLLGQTPQLDGELRQLLFGDDLHGPRDRLAIQKLQLRQARDDVILEARPVRFARVAHHVEVLQVFPVCEVVHARLELVHIDEINS